MVTRTAHPFAPERAMNAEARWHDIVTVLQMRLHVLALALPLFIMLPDPLLPLYFHNFLRMFVIRDFTSLASFTSFTSFASFCFLCFLCFLPSNYR
jgi:hypothetical protein